ncbi:hypothetical protein Bca52824_035161 [Brassica carinata]|uniref:TF-B3 domain-containing protein n=1 Tax=Brassica carinata TaxID=52824 RepID=A0A8X7S738_BRACI|nr:hypothetical protein Bca52824_035161 [Brassica carinata]
MESIVSTVGKMIDSRFNAYGFDQNKTLEDIVKDTLEERLKVLGVGKRNENIDNLSIATGEEGVKRILAGDFDRANATPVKTSNVDFVVVSPAKTCKDDKVANCPPLRRGTRIRQGLKLKDEDEAEDDAAKKKAAKAEAYLKKKEMDDSECAVVADAYEVLPESEISGQDLRALSVKIPLRFFSTHIEGKTNQKTWKLRSDASVQTWEVIQEGRRLTGGWKDFTTAHDLRIGDIVIFKHEGDMVFHVTPFGPSCCEIQYTHPNIIKEEADADDAPSFSFDYCFLAEITASNLKEDKLYLSVEATTCTALNKQC